MLPFAFRLRCWSYLFSVIWGARYGRCGSSLLNLLHLNEYNINKYFAYSAFQKIVLFPDNFRRGGLHLSPISLFNKKWLTLWLWDIFKVHRSVINLRLHCPKPSTCKCYVHPLSTRQINLRLAKKPSKAFPTSQTGHVWCSKNIYWLHPVFGQTLHYRKQNIRYKKEVIIGKPAIIDL